MSDATHDDLLAVVRRHWTERDPVPEDLVVRMQAAAAMADSDGLEVELMVLVERSEELAGVRGGTGTVYTLRYASEGTDLLLRVALEDTGSRIDGWVVPPEPMTVLVLDPGGAVLLRESVSANGRFELSGLAAGMLRLRLEPEDQARAPFVTPTFEI